MIGKKISVALSFIDDDCTLGTIIGQHYWDEIDYFVVQYFHWGTEHTLLIPAKDIHLYNPF